VKSAPTGRPTKQLRPATGLARRKQAIAPETAHNFGYHTLAFAELAKTVVGNRGLDDRTASFKAAASFRR
jgi:hypothetical protein